MDTREKPAAPAPRQAEKPVPPAGTGLSTGLARDGLAEESGAGIRAEIQSADRNALVERRPPYLKLAFANPYNLSLLTGGLAAALLTANPILALGALGLEALWLLHAPDSRRLRRVFWDPRFARLQQALAAENRARLLAGLSPETRRRVDALLQRNDEIRRLAAENPSFAGDLLQDELVKTERLADAYIEMALTSERYESYLETVDPDGLERDRRRYEKVVADAGDDAEQAGIAKRNLAVVAKRLEKIEEIRRYLTVARGELDLIENSFQLIADQIVTIRSPQELSGQLDELLNGVETVRETSRETEKILAGIDRSP